MESKDDFRVILLLIKENVNFFGGGFGGVILSRCEDLDFDLPRRGRSWVEVLQNQYQILRT